MQRSALCRSRREFSNEYLLEKFGFDTTENEPCSPLSAYRSPRSGLQVKTCSEYKYQHTSRRQNRSISNVVNQDHRPIPPLLLLLATAIAAALRDPCSDGGRERARLAVEQEPAEAYDYSDFFPNFWLISGKL